MKTLVLVTVISITSVYQSPDYTDPIEQQALEILETKCNICHRKQNPFKVFNSKNMNRHASKIYTQVFVKKRMPKGDKVKLSNEEYDTLKKWIDTQNIK